MRIQFRVWIALCSSAPGAVWISVTKSDAFGAGNAMPQCAQSAAALQCCSCAAPAPQGLPFPAYLHVYSYP